MSNTAEITGMKGAAGGPEKRTRPRRTTAVYFADLRELRRVKKAARATGVPWTRFIREACVARADRVLAGISEPGEAA